MRSFAVAAIMGLGSLQLASCRQPPHAPSDDHIIADLAADRAGFEEIADVLRPGSPVMRVERRNGVWFSLPAGAGGDQAALVQRFLTRHGIDSAATKPVPAPSGRQVWFVLFEGAPDKLEYQSKTLINGPADAAWRWVDDTDRAVRPPLSKPVVVYRALGDGWYIRNSAY